MSTFNSLVRKYNVAVPRYTSYPTVPLWENNIDELQWKKTVQKAFQDFGKKEGISLYIHLPYCESLCTYCGCNKRITKNHDIEEPYITAIMQEWKEYLKILPGKPKLAGIHLGGGTPTFFSPKHLYEMLNYIIQSSDLLPDADMSFEGHPNNTSFEHLVTLKLLGFKRVSYGIQDFDEQVQKSIHRIQPFEKVKTAVDNARLVGFEAINFDLIYGLPHQSVDTIKNTFEQVARLKPDRIAFYSYAHVPSVFPAQKSFEEFLPLQEEKRSLYEKGHQLLLDMGYFEVGMDHFALKEDPLFIAKEQGQLHRNFMGYTPKPSSMLLGLGNSAISDIHYAYAQNTKDIELYKEQVGLEHFPLTKGHLMSKEDIQTRNTIMTLICQGKAKMIDTYWHMDTINELMEFQKDELVEIRKGTINILEKGMPFIRNICAVFDHRMRNQKSKKFVFSKAI
ncbi:oxygen-independent coproporphyrinogen III oxidase [Echinicola salinicaeni]|uniref:oxygen-independent coproporphyrinogen III oxidase n=1 Tax=Echinicola salinicaeni TaxID=2762757 RepID=UPI001645BAAD|nr:oxygen-independent coproporphyrinogen III oxidase [Echinicola salinicaeni]